MQTVIGSQFPEAVIPLIKDSKNSINIIVYDWRFYPQDPAAIAQQFNQAIVEAVRRGVKVKAILNNKQPINYLNQQGIEARQLNTARIVHCKLMIIDDKIIILGSHNYTQHAFTLNYELSIILKQETEQTDFLTFFNNLWPK